MQITKQSCAGYARGGGGGVRGGEMEGREDWDVTVLGRIVTTLFTFRYV